MTILWSYRRYLLVLYGLRPTPRSSRLENNWGIYTDVGSWDDYPDFWTKSSSPTNRSPRVLSVPWTCWNWEPICSKKFTRAPCTCWETIAFNWSSETGGYLFLDASFDPSFWDESFGPSFPEPFTIDLYRQTFRFLDGCGCYHQEDCVLENAMVACKFLIPLPLPSHQDFWRRRSNQ